MSDVGQPERATQNRVISLFCDELDYRYLGDWADRGGNSNIEEHLLSAWLTKCGYTPAQISAALHKLRTEAGNHSRGLYGNNQAVYNLLRYGLPVKTEASDEHSITEALDEYSAAGDAVLEKALEVDAAVKRVRPDGSIHAAVARLSGDAQHKSAHAQGLGL